MTLNRYLSFWLLLVAALIFTVAPVWADRGRGGGHGNRGKDYHHQRGYSHDRRHGHDHNYLPPETIITSLPHGYGVVSHRGSTFYFHDGSWYVHSGNHYRVVLPPRGLFVSVLPPHYTTIRTTRHPYYYAGGVYYEYHQDEDIYMVTDPPLESEVIRD